MSRQCLDMVTQKTVAKGDVLAVAYSDKSDVQSALEEIGGAYCVEKEKPSLPPLIREYIRQ